MRAVEERETFFCFERDGRDSCAPHGFAAVEDFAFVCGVAFADDDVREMRERREIAGSADGTLRGNHRMHFGVQHCAECLDDERPDAAQSFGESVGAQKHHRARFGFAERRADAAGSASGRD